MEFREFLLGKYEAWSKENDGGQKGFAKYLGIPATSLSNWINSGHTPGKVSISLLVEKLGTEVYDALGMERPHAAVELLPSLPPEFRRQLLSATHELADKLAEYKINPDSDAGEALADEVFQKHGFIRKRTSQSGAPGNS